MGSPAAKLSTGWRTLNQFTEAACTDVVEKWFCTAQAMRGSAAARTEMIRFFLAHTSTRQDQD
jgi:hypothetical protein